MPKLSDRMEKGVLVAWDKNVGDEVKKGEVLFEVETNKVVNEIEAPCDGVITDVYFEEGDAVEVGKTIAEYEVK